MPRTSLSPLAPTIVSEEDLRRSADIIGGNSAVARLNAAEACHARLVAAVREWVAEHMDQWEKFKLSTPHGQIFVSISMQSDCPDSFDDAADLTDTPASVVAGL